MSHPFGPDQPRVCANDWTVLDVPDLGGWQPTLSVSVVIPAHDPAHLPKVLAGLAAQSYPAELLEVVVVDDGSDPPVTLPELLPQNTTVVRTTDTWGRAAACQLGVERSDGQVLHWLDSDVVPGRGAVEAHLRWHHLIDYAVVLGHKAFVADEGLDHLTSADVRDAIAAGTDPSALARGEVTTHWTDQIQSDTRHLADAGPRAMRMHIGLSGSVGRSLYDASGGMPVDLVLGEDIVLGYRLREAGAVFIPDPAAGCLHLGTSGVMRGADGVNRYNKPFITDKVPEFRGHRLMLPRSYEVPYVEAVVPVASASYEAVRVVVDSLLAGGVPDLVVSLVAGWTALSRGRRQVLTDPRLDLRLVAAAYASDPRVSLLESVEAVSEATFRLTLPGPDVFPAGKALRRLLYEMENDHVGTVLVDLGNAGQARIERTAAVARARRISCGEPTDDVLRAIYPTRETNAPAAGFVPAQDAPTIRQLPGLVPWGMT